MHQVTDEQFESLPGHPIPEGRWGGEREENDALCQIYCAISGLVRLIRGYFRNRKLKAGFAQKLGEDA